MDLISFVLETKKLIEGGFFSVTLGRKNGHH